ncbi:NAD(P)/FAD-dependent oxidoreductase [Gloeocapsopsis dulcis]|uniref:FAD-dependent oxidoreductase n=1 Tax=Gloeocapsopsis dulcis AAB1 = 1H9 TaxID=1433147 RepID=A0A6N8FY65_9CHRO|nr:FAD-dependent oxidoreductase [Gloeocapsopsis dulcis]MUL38078.1 FAD-dependent oxidoreductase [Gloeocapsopsis dulcis AAB1 = 1H9]WNN91765.1 FAD-dependent oxidoreductase [Gloeocapsopsis dulcis]
MSHVLIVGCGVVGAAIAYELSLSGLKVTVVDQQPPAQAATGAALGVLMGAISHKIKGNAWQMRSTSINRYETLIPELEALTMRRIPLNRQGILMLCFQEEDLADWEKLAAVRSAQGWQLEIWNAAQLQLRCPHLNSEKIVAAIYSPQDRQVEPIPLTLALVEAAQRKGVQFHFGVKVAGYHFDAAQQQMYLYIDTTSTVEKAKFSEIQNVDWLVIAAGTGSTHLQSRQQFSPDADLTKIAISSPNSPQIQPTPVVDIKPVLGQALHLQVNQPLGDPNFQPVITGDDVHVVPRIGSQPITDYWIGATVEFPTDRQIIANPAQLEQVRQQAITFCPALAAAKIIRTWSGLRPRPEGRPAPVIESHGFSNILLATGHYRNGVLLAPATAQKIREVITKGER